MTPAPSPTLSLALCHAVVPPGATLALAAATALPGGSEAPDWIHLLPAGEIRTVDGRGPYRLRDAAAVIAASLQGADRLPIDENHALDLAAPRGEASPARGWITELEARDDGIWGRVEWTGAGRALVADRAYRHISPAILHLAGGEIVGIARASLVNRPNLQGLVALNSESTMDLDQLRRALGLPATATEADILAAAQRAGAALATQGAQLAPIAKAAGLAETADAAAITLAVQGLADPARSVPAAQVVALQQQLQALSEATARDKATAFVDAAIKAGKVGVKPLRDHYIARHMAEPAAVEKELGAMMALQGPQLARQPATPKEGEAALDDSDRTVIALMGIDPAAFAKTKAADLAEEAL